jgi:serine/threonine protein kinase
MPEENDSTQPGEALHFNASAAEVMFARAWESARQGGGAWVPPRLEEMARLLPGYDLVALLGRGGMGAVYQARQRSLDRAVAIKLLPLEVGADRAFVERFIREAHTLARLNHPNIVAVHESGQTSEGHFYFVMEFVEGTNLAEIIHGPGLAPAQVLEIIARVCEALHYAHRQGVVHRDIKPANILISTDGRVKVADFGLARGPAIDAPGGQTQTGAVMGTPAYMAPEQLHGQPVDLRADIYALGVVLYEMLCREVPRGAFPTPSKRAQVDARLDDIVFKAMQPRREERYQTTAEMQAALERISTTAPVPALPTPVKKKRRVWVGTGVLVLAAAFGATKFWPQPHPIPAAALTASSTPTPAPADLGKPASSVTFETATRENPFINSLGMKFVPVPIVGGPTDGARVLFSVWETRVQDYNGFVAEAWPPLPPRPRPPEASHPVTSVSWDEARDFCQWLTQRERRLGKISTGHRYRLPSDREWTCAAGIGDRENPDRHPWEINGKVPGVFPWGTEWPPPSGAGNLGGEEFAVRKVQHQRTVEGYRDDFIETAPVGSFTVNSFGLFDLAGNVAEWCEDLWPSTNPAFPDRRIVRSSDFGSGAQELLLSSLRQSDHASVRMASRGFRIVLAPDALTPVAPPSPTASPGPTSAALAWMEGPWVDWFAEQARASIVPPNFEKSGAHWKSKSGVHFALFSSPRRDMAVRVTLQAGERFDAPNILLRREPGPNFPIAASYMGRIMRDGSLAIVQITEGHYRTLASNQLADFDPNQEFTLEFEARGKTLTLSFNGRGMVAVNDDAYSTGETHLFVPVGSIISRLEYRLLSPPAGRP